MQRPGTSILLLTCALLSACAGGDTSEGTGPTGGTGNKPPNDSTTNTPPPVATTMARMSVEAQSGVVGDTVQQAPAVKVTDQRGQPMSGVAVTWAIVAGGGSISANGGTTGSDGIARVSWMLGSVPATNTLEARLGSLAPVRFTATSVAGPVAFLLTSPDSVYLDLLGDTMRVRVSSTDRFGNPTTLPTLSWTSNDTTVLAMDATGLARARGRGTASITIAAGSVSRAIRATVFQPTLSVTPVDTALIRHFLIFGAPLDASRLNPTYELLTEDDSMVVRAVSDGWVDYVRDQGSDSEIFIRMTDTWMVTYDHVIDVRVHMGSVVHAGDVIGIVPFYGNYQVGMELRPMGRMEIQLNYGRNNQPQTAWCPALFGASAFNTAFSAVLARTNPGEPSPCRVNSLSP